MSVVCLLFGHRRPWPTVADDHEYRGIYGEHEAEHPFMGNFRVGPCLRCKTWFFIGWFNDVGRP